MIHFNYILENIIGIFLCFVSLGDLTDDFWKLIYRWNHIYTGRASQVTLYYSMSLKS